MTYPNAPPTPLGRLLVVVAAMHKATHTIDPTSLDSVLRTLGGEATRLHRVVVEEHQIKHGDN